VYKTFNYERARNAKDEVKSNTFGLQNTRMETLARRTDSGNCILEKGHALVPPAWKADEVKHSSKIGPIKTYLRP